MGHYLDISNFYWSLQLNKGDYFAYKGRTSTASRLGGSFPRYWHRIHWPRC